MGKFNSLLNPTSQLSENYIYERPEMDFVGEEGEDEVEGPGDFSVAVLLTEVGDFLED